MPSHTASISASVSPGNIGSDSSPGRPVASHRGIASVEHRQGWLIWERPGVVDPGSDAALRRAPRPEHHGSRADREQVVDVRFVRAGVCRQLNELLETLAIASGMCATGLVPGIQVVQLDAQKGRLEAVQPLVISRHGMPAVATPQVAQRARGGRQLGIVRADRSPIAQCPQILARVEAEGSRSPQRAGASPAVAGPVTLGRIFEHGQPRLGGQRVQGIHRTNLAIKVDGNDRRCFRPDRGAGSLDTDQTRAAIHVDAHRRGASMDDGQCRGQERVGRDDYLVTGADSRRLEH